QLVHDLSLVVDGPPVVRGLAARGVRSMLRVLIGARESPLGVIAVASRRPGALTDADALELREISRPLAVAIGYFERRQESERRATRLEVTNRALEALTYAGTPGELASAFLRECEALFDSAYGLVVQWDPDGRARVVAADGPAAVTPDEALAGLDKQQLRSGPIALDVSQAGDQRAGLEAAGLRHGLSAPLMAGGEARGAVVIWTRQQQPLAADDLALVATLTRPLSIAIERAAAGAALSESESKYRSLIAQADEMIYVFDGETLEILEANAYGSRILGYTDDELCAMKTTDIIDDTVDHIRANVRRALDEGEARLPARPYRRRDGSIVVMDVVTSMIAFEGRQAILVMGRDVSERHVIEQRLIQGQKMEALGQMAGNVAHDFNNLLTTVLGFAGLLKRAPGMDETALEHLGLIEDAARRAADLSSRMLSFARGGLVKFGPVDLRAVIEQTLRLAEAGLSSAITVRSRLPAKPVIVEGDAGQLQQALLNIVINARDAMPHGGMLTVRLREAGDGCVLSIADTGMGMTEETRMRLFEPFYTTKPAGSGTGLGMAITYGIVQGHHGSIAVTTAPGHGTTFSIHLPLLDMEQLPEPPLAPEPGSGRTHGAVLVVDDDDLVRRTMTATLVDMGYTVVAASGGAEALELVKAGPERFAAVVLDLVMAGMSGSATFHALQDVRKDLPVIICTGFADDEHVDIGVQRGAAAVIYKPFNPDGLARALQLAGAFAG
ncbi:MAG TPA: ATP-binding protein, partial [Tepidiformaceae bacterium]|nr:ATP-binding protein [Tepidiformaceae bacterium]